MKVYAVMCESWNGEYSVEGVYALYLKEADANYFVDALMALPEGKTRSAYSPIYWVDEMDVFG